MKEKIIENWKAIEENEQLAREKTGDPKAGFNASTFFFGEEGRHLMIPIMYRGKKGKKGQEEFTQSYKNIMVIALYCPFTGKPLYADLEKAEIEEAKENLIILNEEKEKQNSISFVNWLMDNCELSSDNSLWSYESEDYTNEKLFEIFNQNRCNVCGQGLDVDNECPTGHNQILNSKIKS